MCPNCGADVFPNVRVGPEFVDGAHMPAGDRLGQWLSDAPGDVRLLVPEFGAGFHTPGEIRLPAETSYATPPGARLVRVSPERPDVPADLGDRALSVPLGADALLDALAE